jgi:hypothetical protein
VGDLLLDIAAFGERLARMSAGETARYVEAAAFGSAAGDAADEGAMFACAVWLTQHVGDRRVAAARDAARADGARIAELVLDDAPPYRRLDPRARRPQPGPTHLERLALRAHLGKYRTMLLRTAMSARLVGTFVHPSAEHTRRLLAEPALSPRDVVAMAARRPTTTELLVEIAACPRWVMRAEVREALVLNPFTPPSIAVRLLPTLPILRRTRGSVDLHPHVREVATLLLGPRPAIPTV